MNVVTRAQWGARPPKSRTVLDGPLDGLWLHHTATPYTGTGRDAMRAIQRFHQDSRGWADIGYSFVVDPRDATVYEGRGLLVAGAHTRGHNRTSHGIAVMGDFNDRTVDALLIDTLARLAVWLHRQGAQSDAQYTGGHRDVGSTACPGDNLHASISRINDRAKYLLTDDRSDDKVRTSDLDGWKRNVADYAIEQEWFREPTDWSRNADQFMVAHVARKIHRDLIRRMEQS